MSGKKPEITELIQLEEALVKKEHELQVLYCQIGKSILEIADGGQKTIDALVDDIIETRKKIVAAKHEIQCPECMTYNHGESKYCQRCGMSLKLQSEREDSNESK